MEEKQLTINDKRHHMTPVEQEATGQSDPNAVILMAMQKGYSPELIEKMMELQERYEKNEAKKAYHHAMAQFKADPPKILKDKKAGFEAKGQQVGYSYADLATASEEINKALSNYGLSASWKTEQSNGNITVICTITHKLGHSESTSLSASPDTSGAKNTIQAIGSTISYLERYTLFALTGLAAHGQDDDGNTAGNIEYVTKGEVAAMQKILNEKNIEITLFFSYVHSVIGSEIEKLDDIPKKYFKEILTALRNKKKEPKREPGEEG